jgi:hypothetical protein
MLGNGDGTFQSPTQANAGFDDWPIAVGDFNGDGIPDLVTGAARCVGSVSQTYCQTNGPLLALLLGNGDGSFQYPQTIINGNYSSGALTQLIAGDFNGDGQLDIMAFLWGATIAPSEVGVYLGNGNGTFQVPVVTVLGETSEFSAAVADVNGDGKLDLIVPFGGAWMTGGPGSNVVKVFLGNGDGSFQSPVSYATGIYPFSAAVADVNGDGKPDLVAASWLDDSVSVLAGNGDGTFQAPVSTQAAAYDLRAASCGPGCNLDQLPVIALADFNGDGKLDVAVAGQFSTWVLWGNGDGSFQVTPNYAAGGIVPGPIAAGDVNGDGKLDLVVGNLSGIGVLFGNGDGTFQSAVGYGVTPGALVLSDVNGDGSPDLVYTSGFNVNVQLNNGDGTFQAAVGYGAGGAAGSGGIGGLAVADVNGDGKPDLVVGVTAAGTCPDPGCDPNTGGVTVLLGNGDGTFQTATTFNSGSAPNPAVAIGDLNGDGRPDVLATSGNNVEVLVGNGDGTFQAAVGYAAGSSPASIVVGDFNGDGKLDVAVLNYGPYGVSVLLGNGDGTLKAPAFYAGDLPGTSLIVGDFNADGKLDLAVADLGLAGAGVYLGNGDGTFQPEVGFGSEIGAGFLAAGDFNGDGSLDLAVSNRDAQGYSGTNIFGSLNVSILLNRLTRTPVTLVSSANPSGFHESITLTATVNASDTGTVTFYDGSTALGTQPISGGAAALTTSALSVGSNSLTASASGPGYTTSTSPVVNQVVNRATTTSTLASSANPSDSGQSVTFTAAITPQYGGSATGTVTFYNGATALGSGSVSGNSASYSTSSLSTGSHSITAKYSGDGNFTGSTSPVLKQTVSKIAFTTTTITSVTPNPADYHEAIVLNVTVSGGATTPTGKVTFTYGSPATTLGTATLSGGTASFTIAATKFSVGTYQVTAGYAGNASHAASASQPTAVTVNLGPTATSLVPSANPSTKGQSVTFTATVTPQYGGTLSGTVTFSEGTTVLKTVNLSRAGTAAYTTKKLATGSDTGLPAVRTR